MKTDKDNPRYINIVGSACSGTGAVFEYLKGRGDLYDPLFGEEYLLPSLPNGLMALNAITEKASDPSITEHSLKEFQNLTEDLIKYWSSKQNNEKLNHNIIIFENAIEKFLKDITHVNYPMRLLSHQLSQSNVKILISKIKRRLGLTIDNPKTRLIVSQKKFLEATQKLHDSMFSQNANNRKIIITRGCSVWSLNESSKFFLNSKIVVINRDPRDQFVELRSYKQAYSVESFINWYKELQKRLSSINDSNVLLINFEDFVKKNNKFKKILCDHVSLNDITSSYDPELSKKNVGKFDKYLDRKEIMSIEENLSEYFYFD